MGDNNAYVRVLFYDLSDEDQNNIASETPQAKITYTTYRKPRYRSKIEAIILFTEICACASSLTACPSAHSGWKRGNTMPAALVGDIVCVIGAPDCL